MATHSSVLAWIVPWTEEPGGLLSTGSQSRTRLSDFAAAAADAQCDGPTHREVTATAKPTLTPHALLSACTSGALDMHPHTRSLASAQGHSLGSLGNPTVACLLEWLGYSAEGGFSTRSGVTRCRDTGRHQRRTVTETGVRPIPVVGREAPTLQGAQRGCWSVPGHPQRPQRGAWRAAPWTRGGNSGPRV